MSPWARHTGALGLVVAGVLLAHVLAASGPGPSGAVLGSQPNSTPAPTQSAPPGGSEPSWWSVGAWSGTAAGLREARPAAVPTVVAVDQSGTVGASLRRGTLADSPPPPDVAAAIARHFPPHAVAQAQWIAWCESRNQPTAVGDGGRAQGLFQVHAIYWGDVPDDVEGQVRQAAAIHAQHGFAPWSCR